MFKSKRFWVSVAGYTAFIWLLAGCPLDMDKIALFAATAILGVIMLRFIEGSCEKEFVSDKKGNHRYSLLIKVYLKNGIQHEVTFYSDTSYANIMDLARHTDRVTYERTYIGWQRDGKQYSFLYGGISCVEYIVTDLIEHSEIMLK